MPELPEVETVVRGIRPHLVGRMIRKAQFTVPRQVHPHTPQALARILRGQTIHDVQRRGKYILLRLGSGVLLVHLRMTGALSVRPCQPRQKHERVLLALDDGRRELVFHDPRSLGTIRFCSPPEAAELLARLGWEPLDGMPDVHTLRETLARRRAAIKLVLLDQRVWAGIGNIYASEILYQAGIDPRTRASSLSMEQLERLRRAVPLVLKRALRKGGTTIANFAAPDNTPGAYQKEFRVYAREEEPCRRCGTAIRRIVQGQRSTYYCPQCQRRR